MYNPAELYVDPFLTDFAVSFETPDLIGREVMPIMETSLPSAKYRVFDRSAWLIYNDRREPLTVANEISGGKWSLDTYSVFEHSLQAPVSDEEREILGRVSPASSIAADLDPEADATETVTRSIRLGHEKAVADLVRNTATYPVGHTVTLATADQWDNYSNAASDPVADIKVATRQIYRATGLTANLMVIPWEVYTMLEDHPKIIDRFKNFQLTVEDAFLKLAGFKGRVLVAESVYNAADNIDAAESLVQLWGKDVFIGYVDPNAESRQNRRTFGRTFAMPYDDGIMPIDRWREQSRKADIVRASMRYDLKVVSGKSGYLIKAAIA